MWLKKITNDKRIRLLIIIAVVLFKLILMGLFSSDYQDKMFIPFVSFFLDGKNPYEYYYQNDMLEAFPYFPAMLLIESVGGLLLKAFNPANVFLQNLIFKQPLLLFDILCYWMLRKMGLRYKYAMAFYFVSPIMLYSTFMHGQLDIIPTALLVTAVYYVTRWERKSDLLWYALFMGLALSTKAHIIAAFPILFFYVATKRGYGQSFKYVAMSITVVVLFCVGFWGEGFIQRVLFNREQMGMMTLTVKYGAQSLVISIAVLFIIYAKVYELNYFNKNLLYSFLGLMYSVFVICVAPIPSRFVWIVPFIALFFGYVSKDKYKVMMLYGGVLT